MKQPKSKLPWSSEPCRTGKDCWCRVINDGDNSSRGVVNSGSVDKEDAEYIVEEANNYHKAIELLKKDCEALLEEYNRPELNEFLESINEF